MGSLFYLESDMSQTAMELQSPADNCHAMFRDAPSGLEFNKLRKRLIRHTREAQ